MTYQASKKTDFTVDLIWWGSLKLAPTKLIAPNTKLLKMTLECVDFLEEAVISYG